MSNFTDYIHKFCNRVLVTLFWLVATPIISISLITEYILITLLGFPISFLMWLFFGKAFDVICYRFITLRIITQFEKIAHRIMSL